MTPKVDICEKLHTNCWVELKAGELLWKKGNVCMLQDLIKVRSDSDVESLLASRGKVVIGSTSQLEYFVRLSSWHEIYESSQEPPSRQPIFVHLDNIGEVEGVHLRVDII